MLLSCIFVAQNQCFFFMRLVEEGSNSKEKMQTALFFMFAKKKTKKKQPLLYVRFLMWLILFSEQQNATPKYS